MFTGGGIPVIVCALLQHLFKAETAEGWSETGVVEPLVSGPSRQEDRWKISYKTTRHENRLIK